MLILMLVFLLLFLSFLSNLEAPFKVCLPAGWIIQFAANNLVTNHFQITIFTSAINLSARVYFVIKTV